MTPPEAIQKLKVLRQFTNPISRNDVAIDMAVEALEKSDTCRWHDLRKCPDDLPEVGVDVLVFGIDESLPCYQVCTYGSGIGYGFEYYADHTSYYFERPIAWKYIEPMEGEGT